MLASICWPDLDPWAMVGHSLQEPHTAAALRVHYTQREALGSSTFSPGLAGEGWDLGAVIPAFWLVAVCSVRDSNILRLKMGLWII